MCASVFRYDAASLDQSDIINIIRRSKPGNIYFHQVSERSFNFCFYFISDLRVSMLDFTSDLIVGMLLFL